MLTTAIGAALGKAIDASDGEDSSWDGALKGVIIANVVRVAVPVIITYAVGWAVLNGLGKVSGAVFGGDDDDA